ncbi:MFS transporter [Stutzerimonas kirkiae]|uniref:MFS transporter n=1 Tax=Stutzerimonas kirkiae TaxID=2211392 RepID=A0A4Q9RD45_9GAMM|nr:MFS transporter [Stutzerimonas kirkiae]TBU99216.1 MFS transporter [Stutzerimonas kirkiae]TBV06324.1 MFS transporter [Stutzerimonas kirkiae]TBV08068.1 MFS transporter [Stutzerimonas kirkiae]TBV15785.1 MFS transporter [Stutzerimonas kirkiae]
MRAGSWPSVLLTLAFAVIIAACHGKTILLVADIAAAFDVTPAQASWVVSAVAIVAALASPLVNWAVARVGERRAIVFGLLLAASCSYLASHSQSFAGLLALRVIEGAGYISVVLAALALLIHTTQGKRRTSALAFWSVASPLGGAIAIFAVSPYIGNGQWRVAFSGHAVVLLALLLATPLLPSVNLASRSERKPLSRVFDIYTDPSVLRLALAVGAPLTVALGLVAIVPDYLIRQLGVAPATIGVISTLGILSSVLAGLFAGFILNLPRIGPLSVIAGAVVGVSLEIIFFLPGIGTAAAVAIKIVQGFFSSFVVAWVFTSIPKMSRHGDVMGAGGIAEQALYLSMFLGPVLLFPLFALPSKLPFFAALLVANLLPLLLLPLGLRREADPVVAEARPA